MSKSDFARQVSKGGGITIAHRAARMGRNPKTGEAIQIKVSKTLRFKPSAQLKKAAGA